MTDKIGCPKFKRVSKRHPDTPSGEHFATPPPPPPPNIQTQRGGWAGMQY